MSPLPRELHPVAWWLWALGLAVAASRTTNPLLLISIVIVVCAVAAARSPRAGRRSALRGYMILALVIIGIRVVFRVVLGGGGGSHVLFRLPEIPLPASSGIRAGGPVTLENVIGALYDGLRLATLLVCFGAANVLANPKRLVKAAPAALHEIGVAVTVAVTVAPQLIDSASRVRRARRLRSGGGKGMHVVRQIVIPVLTDALDRSLMLAASMDARGHGSRAGRPDASRRVGAALLLTGLCGVCIGMYALVDGTVDRTLGVPALAAGAVLATVGVVLGNRRLSVTTYRAAPWRGPEWVVAGCGVATAVGLAMEIRLDNGDLNPRVLEWPVLPLAAFAVVLLGALPLLSAPRVPR